MCGDTFIQIIRDARVKAAVITLDDINMPCHEKWWSPLFEWASIAIFRLGQSLIFAVRFHQQPIIGGLIFVTFTVEIFYSKLAPIMAAESEIFKTLVAPRAAALYRWQLCFEMMG